MAKENSDNIYNILLGIRDDIGQLKSSNKYQTDKLHSIEEQTKKTNGRVGKAEDFMIEQVKINSRIEGLYKSSMENTRLAVENMENKSDREIDEFKKKANVEELDIKKMNIEYSGKAKLAIIGGVISILSIVATAFISYNVGADKINAPDLSNVNNIMNK